MENRDSAVTTEQNPTDDAPNAVYCTVCGLPYAATLKKCPHCARKKPKSFYNKWWFWLIIAFTLIALVMQVNDADNENKASSKADAPAVQAEEIVLTEDEYKAQCSVLAYDAIARNPGDYADQKITFKGKVIQVQESGKNVVLRVNVTQGDYGFWDDTIYVEYKRKDDAESRILEEDIITLYGTVKGIKKYTAVLGQQVSLPHIQAEYIDIS